MTFQPSQLTRAREIRGLNITELAKKIEKTRQTVSYYEQGKRAPLDSVLAKISDQLDFPVEFFYKEDDPPKKVGAAFYRTMASSTAPSRTAIVRIGEIGYECYSYLSQYLNLPKPDKPFLDFYLLKDTLTYDDISDIAQLTRIQWGLGDEPITSLLTLLESKGIVVVNGGSIGYATDACFIPFSGLDVIVLGEKDGQPGTAFRQNFSLAHELGHILLHRHITNEDIGNKETLRRIEWEANTFASAFLLPEKAFLNTLLSTSLDFLLSIKKRWNTSVAAMIYRCKDLGIITETEYTHLQKQITFRRWRTSEPFDEETPIQKPQLFQLAFDLLLDEGIISKNDIQSRLALNANDITSFFALKSDFFSPNININLEMINNDVL